MSLDPTQPPPRNVALILAQAALQRQNQLLDALGNKDNPATPSTGGPVPNPVVLSEQARAQLANSAAAQPGLTDLTWPVTELDEGTHTLVNALLRLLQGPATSNWKLLGVQAWPEALAQQLDLPPSDTPDSPNLPSPGRGLQPWQVQTGLLQTAAGRQTLQATLSLPNTWWAQHPPATELPMAPLSSRLLLMPDQATPLQSGWFALLIETADQERTSALLALELGAARQAPLYGRDVFTPRSDPWQQQAQLLASGMVPRVAARQGQGASPTCQTPGCPYQGRATCPQPFCPNAVRILPL